MPFLGPVDPLYLNAPPWLIGLLLFIACSLTLEVGHWVGQRQKERRSVSGGASQSSDAKDYIVSSVFRLLALLMRITFAMALDRFDSRVDWVAEEASAIRTTYFRADMLDEPHRAQIRSTLRDYAKARLVPEDAAKTELARIHDRNERLRAQLFHEAQSAVSLAQEPWMTSGFVHSMETALQIGSRRSLAARIPMPSPIIHMLLVYLIVSIGVLGYLLGLEGTHRRYAANSVIALFVLAFLLIIDIDRPRSGPIKVSNLAIEELVREMDQAPTRRNSIPNTASQQPLSVHPIPGRARSP